MDARIIDIPRIYDRRGSLSFIQNGDIAFDIARSYWIYDMPTEGERYGRALKTTSEIIIPLSGSFDVTISDTEGHRKKFSLIRPWQGLLVPPMHWRVIDHIAGGSRALVVSSRLYDEDDYIRDRKVFRKHVPGIIPSPAYVPDTRTDSCNKCHGKCTVDDARIIRLDRHPGNMGSLAVLENNESAPFDIKRVFYIYDVPTDAHRGGHSHFRMQELIVALAGSFDVEVRDGRVGRTFTLSRPNEALYVPCGLWRSLGNFSSGALCLAFASELYDEKDYVRSFEEFRILSGVAHPFETLDYFNKLKKHF